jgi:hypothetical protein
VIQQKFIVGMVEHGILTSFLSVIVDENVTHYSVQPSFNVGSSVVFVFIRQGPVQGFLG